MNTMPEQVTQADGTVLNLVDFKWPMAGLGWWIDPAGGVLKRRADQVPG